MQKMLFACSLFVFAGLAQAQDVIESPSSVGQTNDAVGIHLAPGLRGVASVALASIYNSNYYLTEDSQKSSFGFVLTPNVLLNRQGPKLNFSIGAGLEATRYTNIDVGPTGYVDGAVRGKLDWAALTRHHLSFEYLTRYSHDPFGSFRTENNLNIAEGLDKWLQTDLHGRYRYGAPGALINLETEVGWTGRTYETNRDLTQLLNFRDWEARETAYFNVSSKTAILAEVVHDDLTYQAEAANSPSRDFETTHYRVGMHWIATGTTTGDIRVGKLHRTFDNPSTPDMNALDWTASVSWAPLVYSRFSLQTGIQSQQSYLADVQLLQNRFFLIDWTHEFNYHFRSRVIYSHVNSEFVGSTRVDKLDTFGLEGNYILNNRWMSIAGASYSRRDSNQAGLDYGDSSVYLGLRYGH